MHEYVEFMTSPDIAKALRSNNVPNIVIKRVMAFVSVIDALKVTEFGYIPEYLVDVVLTGKINENRVKIETTGGPDVYAFNTTW